MMVLILLTLGKTNIQANLREASNLASMRMIEEEFLNLASHYQRQKQGDENGNVWFNTQMQILLMQSSKELENTFKSKKFKVLQKNIKEK